MWVSSGLEGAVLFNPNCGYKAQERSGDHRRMRSVDKVAAANGCRHSLLGPHSQHLTGIAKKGPLMKRIESFIIECGKVGGGMPYALDRSC